jgi:hypothetical protein
MSRWAGGLDEVAGWADVRDGGLSETRKYSWFENWTGREMQGDSEEVRSGDVDRMGSWRTTSAKV